MSTLASQDNDIKTDVAVIVSSSNKLSNGWKGGKRERGKYKNLNNSRKKRKSAFLIPF